MPKSDQIIPVILAGGAGTRLWPLSRQEKPKQFLPIAADRSLLLATLDRAMVVTPNQPLILCQEEHRFLVAEQARQTAAQPRIIVQPADRDTAPAVAAAACLAMTGGEDPLLLVLPTDHRIDDEEEFCRTVQVGATLAAEGLLVTLGVTPTQPHTGYGYLQKGAAITDIPGAAAFRVARFVEKPDGPTAARYLAAGFLWNSGIFLFRASVFLAALRRFDPETAADVEASCGAAHADPDFIRLAAAPFLACRGRSVDYAVMEKADNLAMVELACGWLDVGSWAALWEIGVKDSHGNVCAGTVVAEDCRGNYLRGDGPPVAVLGLEGYVVVSTPEAVVVAPLARAQEIRCLAARFLRGRKTDGPV